MLVTLLLLLIITTRVIILSITWVFQQVWSHTHTHICSIIFIPAQHMSSFCGHFSLPHKIIPRVHEWCTLLSALFILMNDSVLQQATHTGIQYRSSENKSENCFSASLNNVTNWVTNIIIACAILSQISTILISVFKLMLTKVDVSDTKPWHCSQVGMWQMCPSVPKWFTSTLHMFFVFPVFHSLLPFLVISMTSSNFQSSALSQF